MINGVYVNLLNKAIIEWLVLYRLILKSLVPDLHSWTLTQY